MYVLFDKGQEVGRFNPMPGYWEPVSDEEGKRWAGDADLVCKLVSGVSRSTPTLTLSPSQQLDAETTRPLRAAESTQQVLQVPGDLGDQLGARWVWHVQAALQVFHVVTQVHEASPGTRAAMATTNSRQSAAFALRYARPLFVSR